MLFYVESIFLENYIKPSFRTITGAATIALAGLTDDAYGIVFKANWNSYCTILKIEKLNSINPKAKIDAKTYITERRFFTACPPEGVTLFRGTEQVERIRKENGEAAAVESDAYVVPRKRLEVPVFNAMPNKALKDSIGVRFQLFSTQEKRGRVLLFLMGHWEEERIEFKGRAQTKPSAWLGSTVERRRGGFPLGVGMPKTVGPSQCSHKHFSVQMAVCTHMVRWVGGGGYLYN